MGKTAYRKTLTKVSFTAFISMFSVEGVRP